MNIKKILDDCVDEMYSMENGVFIAHPDEIILECGDAYMTRKNIKHIVEHRKGARQSIEEIKEMLGRLSEVILESDFETLNTNSKHPDSILRVKVFKSWERAVAIVMSAPTEDRRLIITAYPYRLMFAYFLLLKKLNASAAGKTPSS
jgi:hypothetical protein